MGLRFRKRISLGKVARVNLSGSGVSLGLGSRGANVNISSKRTTYTAGIPDSGIHYQTSRARRGSGAIGGWLIAGIVFALCVLLTLWLARAANAQLPDYETCVRRGIAYFKEIGSWPRLSDGRDAEQVVKERCRRSTQAFPP